MDIKVDVSSVEAIDLTTPVGTKREYRGDYDEPVEVPMTLGDLVAEKLVEHLKSEEVYPYLRTQVNKVRDQLIEERLKPIIETAIKEPFRKSNTYGEAIGGHVTLRELIMQEVKNFLQKPQPNNMGHIARDSKSFIERIVRDQVTSVLGKELAEVLQEEKNKMIALLREEGARLMTATLESALLKRK